MIGRMEFGMRMWKRLTALCLSTLLVLPLGACQSSRDKTAKNLNIESYITVRIIYNDDTYTDYLNMVAKEFHQSNELVTVQPELAQSDDYLTDIYNDSRNQNAADIFLMSSDDMQKAYLMGLLSENRSFENVYTEKIFGKTGIEACSYNGKLYGYPMSFNTSYLVYNKKFASSVNTFSQITDYCNSYTVNDDNQNVSTLVNWDVSNMFLNFPFVSQYVGLTSMNNQNSAQESDSVSVSPVSMKSSLEHFYNFKDQYGIDRSETSIQSCVDDMKDGKLVYTILDADHFKELADSNVDFGISEIPNLADDLTTKTISETTMAVVNPYTANQEASKAVAKAISYDYADLLPEYAGVQSARRNLKFKNHKEEYTKLYSLYHDSMPKSGLIVSYEFYMRYEIMIHQIWDGKSVDEAYAQFDSFLSSIK